MPRPARPLPTTPPPRPSASSDRAAFGIALDELREWCGLSLKRLEDKHPLLNDSTTSRYLRGGALPGREYVIAFVTVCLTERGYPHDEVNEELEHWHEARRHAKAQLLTTKNATAHQPSPSESPRPPRWRPRRAHLIFGGGIVTAALAAGLVASVATAPRIPGAKTPTSAPSSAAPSPTATTDLRVPPPSPALRWSGVIDALDRKQGIDLDTGRLTDQNATGVDISISGPNSNLDAMSVRVQYAILDGGVRTERSQCENATGWTRYYPHLHTLGKGRQICVRTDEGRLAMLVVERPATLANGTIGFHYFTWKKDGE